MPFPDDQVGQISDALLKLDPGPLAKLRRMEPGGAGSPAFWRLAAALDLDQSSIAAWQRLVRILAILSDKGEPALRRKLHDRTRPLGAVLADGGDKDWNPGGDPRPVLSEARLSRFLNLPGEKRGEALERIARALARTRVSGHGVNGADIARLLLFPDDPKPVQSLARAYYNRLDHTAREESAKEGTV
jgi:CRISPR system Cascade subunit CasB